MKTKAIIIGLILSAFITMPILAANKAVKFKANFIPGGDDSTWDARTYHIDTILAEGTKLKDTQTFAGKLYIPKALFKNGGYLGIYIDLVLCRKDDGEYSTYGDVLHRDFMIFGKDKDEETVAVGVEDEQTGKQLDGSKYATIKETGKYYVLTFKKIRAVPKYTKYGEVNEENLSIPKNLLFYPMISVIINGDFPNRVSGTFYLDKIQMTGAKTVSASYEKKDYLFLDVNRSWWKAIPSIANVPK